MKKENIFFQNFAESAAMACEMAGKLQAFMTGYDPANLEAGMEEIHDIEHRADGKKHELYSELMRAFVTPIDRDELMNISQSIDDVIDAMDDIMIQLSITQVKQIRQDSLPLCELIVRCCNVMSQMMAEFTDYKKSKKLHPLIVDLNRLEEEGDRLYIAAMKNLHATSKDPMEVIIWRDIYTAFETVCDKCEDVADIVEGVLIENV